MDLSRAIILKDSDEKIESDQHFKLCAGPGAGKTRFLINHINQVINVSNRLGNVKKIACITYTNIGVETIIRRLDTSIQYVEVDTIHGFLYKHIVKPYLWAINRELNIPIDKITGHDEVHPTYGLLRQWKEATQQIYLKDDTKLSKALQSLQYYFDKEGNLKIRIKYLGKLRIKIDSLMIYKHMCWQRGLIDHDDVLYLSYCVIERQPQVVEVIRAKFPYIFIDEFQDTSPIQAQIIKRIAEKETIVGIIGDKGQSIYSFQGADVKHFEEFELENMSLYKIENNYRSTQQIIDILNHTRNESGFSQVNPNNIQGTKPRILVGNSIKSYNRAKDICNNENITTLTRTNAVSNMMKYNSDDMLNPLTLNELYLNDSNSTRAEVIYYVINSLEHLKNGNIKGSLKNMHKAYRKVSSFSEKEALKNIQRLINQYDELNKLTLKDFYNNYLFNNYGLKNKITSGSVAAYYSNISYKHIGLSISLEENSSLHRTIHKAKGDEFDNVLLIIPNNDTFKEENEIQFLLKPDISREENRIHYVALSRSKKNLFINLPILSHKNEQNLIRLGFEIERMD